MMWRSNNRDHMRNANVLEGYKPEEVMNKGRGQRKKKRFLSGIDRMMGGGVYPCPNFAFLVNKKSLFLQKCQCIELLTVF